MSTETGHAKNVANFEALISFCSGYGSSYNPANAALQITSLQTQLAAAQNALADCKTKETAYDNAVDLRRDAFEPVKALSTRIVNAFAVSGVADSVIEGARTINRKMQGQRASPVKAAPATATTADTTTPADTPATISSSQQGFDNLIEHLNGLIALVSSHAEYNPNEADLKPITLVNLLAKLRTTNTNVIQAYAGWSNSRIKRDDLLYAAADGLVNTALDVKAYIKSVFGTNSPQFAQVKSIEFKNNR